MKRDRPLILATDEDRLFLDSVKVIMSSAGAAVETASDTELFFESFVRSKPDLLVIGFGSDTQVDHELIAHVRRIDERVPIVAISSDRSEGAMSRAFGLGVNDFLLKPIDRALLVAAVRRRLEGKWNLSGSGDPIKSTLGSIEAKICLDGNIEEIDERGIRFYGNNMIPVGTVVKARSGLFDEIFETMHMPSEEVLLIVESTWFDPSAQKYGSYARFDLSRDRFIEGVRGWIVR